MRIEELTIDTYEVRESLAV